MTEMQELRNQIIVMRSERDQLERYIEFLKTELRTRDLRIEQLKSHIAGTNRLNSSSVRRIQETVAKKMLAGEPVLPNGIGEIYRTEPDHKKILSVLCDVQT